MTPFSSRALDRGLSALLVALVRLRGSEFNPNEAASRIHVSRPYVQDAIRVIAERAALVEDVPRSPTTAEQSSKARPTFGRRTPKTPQGEKP